MKILKKSLAIFLTLALCLSAMLGCLSVSAEGTDPALKINLVPAKDTYAPGETFDVAVYVENFADIKGAEFTVDFGTLTVDAESISSELVPLVPDNEEAEPNYWVNGSTIKFVDTFSEIVSGNLLVVSVTAPTTIPEEPIEVTVSNAKFGLNATELADVTVAGATVVVEEPVVECQHEKTTTSEEVTTPATCTTAGSKTVTETCDACGETVSTTTEEIPALGHTDEDDDNLCDVCETEIIVTNTAIRYKTSAYVADKFGFYADFSRAQLDAYDDFYVEVATEHYRMVGNERYKKVTEVVKYKVMEEGETVEGYLPQFEIMGATYRFLITGVTGYEMTLNTTITVYLYKNGEITEKSSAFTFTYASVLETTFKGSSDAKLRTTIVDLVNYGTAAQKYFADDAANAGTDLALSTDYPDANFVNYQGEATQDAVMDISKVEDNSSFVIASGKELTPNPEITDKLNIFIDTSNLIRFAFNPRTYGLGEINYKVKYTDSYGNVHDVDVAREELEAMGTSGVAYKYGAIALYDAAVNVTVEYYDGTELLATRTVCVNDVAAQFASQAELTDILDALVKLGYSANQLFFG